MTPEIADVPPWMWDVLFDLIDQRDTHPKAGPHEWCACDALAKVPREVVKQAEAINALAHRFRTRMGQQESESAE